MCVRRYDYEECDTESASKLMNHLESQLADGSLVGKTFTSGKKSYTIKNADNFSYVDPIDHSVTKNQVRTTDFVSVSVVR